MAFAKLFETDRGQILVKLDRDDEGDPEVRVYCEPDGCGPSSCAVGWDDDEAGWDAAEKVFAEMDEKTAMEKFASKVFDAASGIH